ncbi:MAG: hypothetical protein FWF25_04975 [Propionibacteriaceae bacterium]|nr:hypothetical protein [Propionibacteriaceae bacterium]
MSVIVLTSACGAPGVTTTTMGLACTWSRKAIAVEADPVGGSSILAGYFRGFQVPAQSVVDLLLAHRNGRLAEQFPLSLIPVESTTAAVLPGPRSHAQARSAVELWEPLSVTWKALASADTDVLVDAGRLGMESFAESLLRLADLILLVTRSDLPSLAAARQWAEQANDTRQDHPEAPPWAVVLIDPGNPYGVRETSSVLGLPVVATLGLDTRGAAVYSVGARPTRSTRLRTDLVTCGQNIRQMLTAVDALIAPRGAL